MGVTHKLTSEVIDHIVHEKKRNPKMSCRALSEMVSKKFNVNVSKSSVSSVLQEAELNSPVGRRSQEDEQAALEAKKPKTDLKKKPIKFKIPDHRKKEIFKEEAAASENVQSDNLITATHAKMSNQSSSQYIDRAGVIFVKALDWSLSGSSVLEHILKLENSGLSAQELRCLADLYSVAKWYGLSHIDEVRSYQGQGLWLFSQLTDLKQRERILSKWGEPAVSATLGLTAELQLKTLKLKATKLKFTLATGRVMHFDFSQRLFLDNNVQSDEGVPLVQATDTTIKQFIRNVQSAQFNYSQIPSQPEEFWRYLNDVWSLGQALSQGAAVGISCLDAGGQELVSYGQVQTQFKYFTMALWSWAAVMPDLVSQMSEHHASPVESIQAGGRKIVYRVISGAEVLLAVKKEMAQTLQVVALSFSVEEKPFVVLLTNRGADLGDIKKAVAEFLRMWPALGTADSLNGSINGTGAFGGPEYPLRAQEMERLFCQAQRVEEVVDVVTRALDLECQAQIFGLKGDFVDEKEMLSRFYQMSGTWEFRDDYLFVTLMPPPQFLEADLLKAAIHRLNHKVIYHPSGARVVVILRA